MKTGRNVSPLTKSEPEHTRDAHEDQRRGGTVREGVVTALRGWLSLHLPLIGPLGSCFHRDSGLRPDASLVVQWL